MACPAIAGVGHCEFHVLAETAAIKMEYGVVVNVIDSDAEGSTALTVAQEVKCGHRVALWGKVCERAASSLAAAPAPKQFPIARGTPAVTPKFSLRTLASHPEDHDAEEGDSSPAVPRKLFQ